MMSVLFMESDDPLAYFKDPGSSGKEVLLLIGVVVVIAAVFFLWAAYVRRPKKMRHTYDHLNDGHDGSRRRRKSGGGNLFGRKHRHRHRRRRSHSEERPINPTLAQVGGLPSRRDEKPPSPPS